MSSRDDYYAGVGELYKTRPQAVHCVQFTGRASTSVIRVLVGDDNFEIEEGERQTAYSVLRKEGWVRLRLSDWVLLTENGEIQVRSDEIFQKEYEKA